MKFTPEQIAIIKDVARGLIGDGSNSEYCRGICELIADLEPALNVDHDERAGQILGELRGLSDDGLNVSKGDL
tara:strand:- start:93 stop:311 length:219 start_codon:yes stop_codon:yes gene_type:complete